MCPWCREAQFLKLYISFPQTSEESDSQSDENDDVRPIQLTYNVFPLLTCGTASFWSPVSSHYSLYVHSQTSWLKPAITAWLVRRMFGRWEKHFFKHDFKQSSALVKSE